MSSKILRNQVYYMFCRVKSISDKLIIKRSDLARYYSVNKYNYKIGDRNNLHDAYNKLIKSYTDDGFIVERECGTSQMLTQTINGKKLVITIELVNKNHIDWNCAVYSTD